MAEAALFQSPTTIYPGDVIQPPREAMAAVKAYVEKAHGNDKGAFRQALYVSAMNAKRGGVPPEIEPSLAKVVSFISLNVPAKEEKDAVALTLRDIGRDKMLQRVLTDERVIGSLNHDLVAFFVENRKLEPTHFWQRWHDRLAEYNPVEFLRRTVQRAPDSKHIPDELRTISMDTDGKLMHIAQRYIGRLLRHPEWLDEPHVGEVRREVMGYVFPKLLERLSDEHFLNALDKRTRRRFEAARNQISAIFAEHLNDAQMDVLLSPEAFDLKITGHIAGQVEVHAKKFEVPEGYKTAIGQEIIIKSVQEEGTSKAQKTPDVVSHNTGYFADHAHWHLGKPEHHIAGDSRDLKGEVHIVHKTAKGDKALVLGAYIEVVEGLAPNPLMQAVLDQAKQHEKVAGEAAAHAPAAAMSYLDFLPKASWDKGTFHRYNGTLTTAPYSDGVEFYLLKNDTVKISPEQYKQLSEHVKIEHGEHDARTTQANRGRAVTEVKASFAR